MLFLVAGSGPVKRHDLVRMVRLEHTTHSCKDGGMVGFWDILDEFWSAPTTAPASSPEVLAVEDGSSITDTEIELEPTEIDSLEPHDDDGYTLVEPEPIHADPNPYYSNSFGGIGCVG